MTAKLFRTSMAVAVSVMVLSIALFMGMLYQYFSDQMMTELESETWLVSRGVELDGMDYLNGLHTTSRVTWVAADGTVLYDNEADASTMENHADREEIREALTSETGTAQRFSSTLSEQTLYVTQRLSDGTVIRLASAQKTVGLLLISMIQPILIILVLSLLLSAVLASRLSKGLIKPILSLDLEHPEDCETYDELTPLLSRLKRQNDTIQQQMNLLKQRQTEFAALRVCRPHRQHVRGLSAPGPAGPRTLPQLGRSAPAGRGGAGGRGQCAGAQPGGALPPGSG